MIRLYHKLVTLLHFFTEVQDEKYILGQFITAEVEVHYNSAAVCGGGVCVE